MVRASSKTSGHRPYLSVQPSPTTTWGWDVHLRDAQGVLVAGVPGTGLYPTAADAQAFAGFAAEMLGRHRPLRCKFGASSGGDLSRSGTTVRRVEVTAGWVVQALRPDGSQVAASVHPSEHGVYNAIAFLEAVSSRVGQPDIYSPLPVRIDRQCSCLYLGQGDCQHRGLSVVGVPRAVPGSRGESPGAYVSVNPDYNASWGWELALRLADTGEPVHTSGR